jgi:hypothetical protein
MKTSEYYAKNPKAKAVKAAYDKKYNKKNAKDKNSRNKVRYMLEKEGRVSKGDGKDIDHVNGNPQDNRKSNLRVVKKSTNRAKK